MRMTSQDVDRHEARVAAGRGKQLRDLPLVDELERQNENHRISQSPVIESPIRNESVAAKKGKTINPASIHVSVVSFRKRLLDPDNLCPKYFIDCLRYAEIIKNDTAKDIALTVSQVKSDNERTEITIDIYWKSVRS